MQKDGEGDKTGDGRRAIGMIMKALKVNENMTENRLF